MARIRFSVVIPTFNRAHTLQYAIDSVLTQSFRQFELILVDDGSSDGTHELVETIDDPRFRYIYQANAGVSAARNRGAAAARGKFLIFLDSDDVALPGWLSCHARAYQSKAVALVCTGYMDYEHGDIHLPEPLGPLFDGVSGQFLAGTFSTAKRLFWQVGGYVEALRQGENWELGMRIVRVCQDEGHRIAAIDEPLIVYHKLNKQSRSRLTMRARHRLESTQYLLETYRPQFDGLPHLKARYLGISGVNAARIGSYALARSYFAEAIRVRPYSLKQYCRYLITYAPSLAQRLWMHSCEDT